MKTGLFGGTFDPIHIGHLIIAETVRSALHLDRILFIPAYISPNKKNRIASDTTVRFEMVQAAIRGNSHFEITDFEITKKNISYTIDTIHEIKKMKKYKDDDLYFMIGSDNLLEFSSWKNPEALFHEVSVVVVRRPNWDIAQSEEKYFRKVQVVNAPLIDISSTKIRKRVRDGQSIRYYVPESVYVIIKEKGLYL